MQQSVAETRLTKSRGRESPTGTLSITQQCPGSYPQPSGQMGQSEKLELMVHLGNREGGGPLTYFQSQSPRVLSKNSEEWEEGGWRGITY